MKKMWKFLSMLLVVATLITQNGITAFAVESDTQETTDAMQQTEQEDTLEEPSSEEITSNEEKSTEAADPEIDTQTTEMEETEEPEIREIVTQEAENPENSWRYENGVPIPQIELQASSNAWSKVNGRYVNDKGEIIPRAIKKGIDVSSWQGDIDWARVKAAGIEFAILRCGRDTVTNDSKFVRNASECERLGIPYGVYLYSKARNTSEAQAEAEHTLRLLQGRSLSYPVYYDMEESSTAEVGGEMLGNIATTYCNAIAAAGYKPGIYANKNWRENILPAWVSTNTNWSQWVAQWASECTFAGQYNAWQCSSTYHVEGIDGNVDLNFWMTPTFDEGPIQTNDTNIINYTTHQQTYGWSAAIGNGYQSGVTGYSKRLEAIKIDIGEGYGDLGVRYSTHVQSYGWQDYVGDGQVAGTTGQSKSMQAIKIELTGSEAEKYDIYYRVHSQSFGWLDWASNGQAAGSEGYDKRMEAIQIAVLPKGSAAPGSTATPFKCSRIRYNVHVQTYGWQGNVYDGGTSGTTGQAKRLEAIQISPTNAAVRASIQYKVHVQTYGWQGWVRGGATAGTTGKAKRLEAIQIQLTGEQAEKYDVYYRVHAQTYGWLDWAKNGDPAGTEGLAKRLEAIEICLVDKGGAAPGATTRSFIKK